MRWKTRDALLMSDGTKLHWRVYCVVGAAIVPHQNRTISQMRSTKKIGFTGGVPILPFIQNSILLHGIAEIKVGQNRLFASHIFHNGQRALEIVNFSNSGCVKKTKTMSTIVISLRGGIRIYIHIQLVPNLSSFRLLSSFPECKGNKQGGQEKIQVFQE